MSSLQLSKLDANARTYGQFIYSSLLNLRESWGVALFQEDLR